MRGPPMDAESAADPILAYRALLEAGEIRERFSAYREAFEIDQQR